jgi:hypothetical protein
MTTQLACSPGPSTRMSAPDRPDLTVTDTVHAPVQVGLDETRSQLPAAAEALDGWHTRRDTDQRHTYVQDGHEAIRLFHAATQDLSRVHVAPAGEIRADQDQRTARVDHLLADLKAERTGGRASGQTRPQTPGAGRGCPVNARPFASLAEAQLNADLLPISVDDPTPMPGERAALAVT